MKSAKSARVGKTVAPQRKRPIYAAGLIERFDNCLLIVLPQSPSEADRLWRFPRDLVASDESPEAGMRRIAHEQLGVNVEVVVGQPPIFARIDDRDVELRFFFCGILSGRVDNGPYKEVRWVTRPHLREYEFDEPSRPVAEWLFTDAK